MNPDKTAQLIDYLEDRLPADQRRALEAEAAASPAMREELQALRRLLADFAAVGEEQPRPALRDTFYRFLQQEEAAAADQNALPAIGRRLRLDWAIAAAVALLLIGVGFGFLWQRNLRQQQQINVLVSEIQMTRKMMVLSMLDQQSASQRLKAVSTAQRQSDTPDPQIIRALVDVLNTDDNINVRVKAAEALLEFAAHPGVVDALTQSLRRQDSPQVQITLIEVLVAIKARSALPEFQRLLRQDELLDVVRNKAAAGIEQLM